MTTVAIVGCTHAGTFAATSILKQHPDWTVHVFERNDSLSFLSCGIALWVGDHVSDPKRMFYSSPKALAEAGATMHMRHDVLDVDVAGKVLRARDMNTGEVGEYRYDKLVITTGSAPVVPPIDGLDEALESGRVLLCKNWDHAMAIKERAGSAKSAVVIGAGYIGAEIAEQFSEIGVKTTLVDALDRVLANNFDATITDDVEQAFDEHGVTLALGQKVTAFRPAAGSDGIEGSGVTVVTEKGEYTADVAILGAGFRPNTALFADQLRMLKNGGDRHRRLHARLIAGQHGARRRVRGGRQRHGPIQPDRRGRLHPARHQCGAAGAAHRREHRRRDEAVSRHAGHQRSAVVRSGDVRHGTHRRRRETPRHRREIDDDHAGLPPRFHAHHHAGDDHAGVEPGHPAHPGCAVPVEA